MKSAALVNLGLYFENFGIFFIGQKRKSENAVPEQVFEDDIPALYMVSSEKPHSVGVCRHVKNSTTDGANSAGKLKQNSHLFQAK